MTSHILHPAFGRPSWQSFPRALRAGVQAIIAVCIERSARRTLDGVNDHLLRDMGVRREEIARNSSAGADWLAPEIRLRMTFSL